MIPERADFDGYLTKAEMYEVAHRHDTPVELDQIMLGGARAESDWNCYARGDIQTNGFPCSRGLFQMNLCGGEGQGYTPEQLDDPDVQWAHMLPIYKRWWAYWRGQGFRAGDLAWRVCVSAERPYDQSEGGSSAVAYRAGYESSYPDDIGPPSGQPTMVDRVFAAGRGLFGTPYRIDPPPDGVNTLDCSLFVQKAVSNAGGPWPVRWTRTVEQIRGECERSGNLAVPWEDVRPGYLLFFDTYEPSEPSQCADGRVMGHIGISYGAGSDRMMDCHAANGYSGAPGVGDTDISGPYWQAHLVEAREPWWYDAGAEEDPAVIAELQSRIADLEAELAQEKGWGTSVIEETARPVRDKLQEALDAAAEQKAPRPTEGWKKVREARDSLTNNLHLDD